MEQSRNWWRAVALVVVFCAAALAIVLGVRPATVQFHRLMMNGLFVAFIKLDGSPVPENARHELLYESDRHQCRLISLGYLERRVHRFRSLVAQGSASTALCLDLSKAMTIGGDHSWWMRSDSIQIVARPDEINRLMAIVESHDVAPIGNASIEPPAE